MMKKGVVTLGFVSFFLVIYGVSAQADVVYDHWSILNVEETITSLGGGLYQYSYEFVNTDVSGIGAFGVWTNFVPDTATFTNFDQKPEWYPTWVLVEEGYPEYDARNLDPDIVFASADWADDCNTDVIETGQYVSGFSFVADDFDPSPKYYFYELECNWAPGDGMISAVGLTATECPSMVGTWTLNGEWERWTAEFTFYADGTFENQYGTAGIWEQSGCHVEWLFDVGVYYWGVMSEDGDFMAGEMLDAAGGPGTWNGARNVYTGCPSMMGFWEINFFWSRGTAVMAFHGDGTFYASDVPHLTGVWVQDDCAVEWLFETDVAYWGAMHSDGSYMAGEMSLDNDGIWDAVPYLGCTDWDLDGYAVEGNDCGPIDCDDGDDDIYPGAPEACNGVDDDCDGVIPADEEDGDVDGWMICEDDCDDSNPGIHPGMQGQDCSNAPDGIDQDCDGTADEDQCGCFITVVR